MLSHHICAIKSNLTTPNLRYLVYMPTVSVIIAAKLEMKESQSECGFTPQTDRKHYFAQPIPWSLFIK